MSGQVTTEQRLCATPGCCAVISQGAASRCRPCYEKRSLKILVYTVSCPDCGRTGRISTEGESAMDLDQLYCPNCEPGTPPMEVSHKGKVL